MIVVTQQARAEVLKRRKGRARPEAPTAAHAAADGHMLAQEGGGDAGGAARAQAWGELSGPERAALENGHGITWDADSGTLRDGSSGEPVSFADARTLLHPGDAAKSAAGRGTGPVPGQISADRFDHPYLSPGRAAPSPGQDPPHQAELPPPGGTQASDYTRGLLTGGHAAPSPGHGTPLPSYEAPLQQVDLRSDRGHARQLNVQALMPPGGER